jgi:ligand-binding sensor domain-containing protein
MKPQTPITFLLFLMLTLSACTSQATSQNTADSSTGNKTTTLGRPASELPIGVPVIYQDQQNNHWFAGTDQGVYRYDGNRFTLFTKEDGLCAYGVLGIQEDKEGNLYFDTTEGISKFDGEKFITLEVGDTASAQNEWQLTPDDLWFRMGWDRPGPYRYDGQKLYALEFPKPERVDTFYAKFPNSSYLPYGIYSSYRDSKGVLWFGTASLGVCRYDGKTISWLYEKQLTETPKGGDFGIRSIIEDKAGDFWFCNTRYRYDIQPSSSIRNETNYINYQKEDGIGYTTAQGVTDFPYFMSIVEDQDGNLWMATYSDGVWRYDGEELLHYPVKNGEKEVSIFSIYRDRQGVLWLGTHNAGAYRYSNGNFELFAG